MMRGVQKANARMVTSALLGSFKTNPQTRAEFMSLISHI
jgi:GTP cyclohydrolase I